MSGSAAALPPVEFLSQMFEFESALRARLALRVDPRDLEDRLQELFARVLVVAESGSQCQKRLPTRRLRRVAFAMLEDVVRDAHDDGHREALLAAAPMAPPIPVAPARRGLAAWRLLTGQRLRTAWRRRGDPAELARLTELIRTFPSIRRQAFTLYKVYDCTLAQIAVILAISEGAVVHHLATAARAFADPPVAAAQPTQMPAERRLLTPLHAIARLADSAWWMLKAAQR